VAVSVCNRRQEPPSRLEWPWYVTRLDPRPQGVPFTRVSAGAVWQAGAGLDLRPAGAVPGVAGGPGSPADWAQRGLQGRGSGRILRAAGPGVKTWGIQLKGSVPTFSALSKPPANRQHGRCLLVQDEGRQRSIVWDAALGHLDQMQARSRACRPLRAELPPAGTDWTAGVGVVGPAGAAGTGLSRACRGVSWRRWLALAAAAGLVCAQAPAAGSNCGPDPGDL